MIHIYWFQKLMIKGFFIVLLFITPAFSIGINTYVDSIIYDNSGIIKLSKEFIIPETVTISDSSYLIDSLDWVFGKVFISCNKKTLDNVVKVKYEYLLGEFPIRVGSNWRDVKLLNMNTEKKYPSKYINVKKNKNSVYSNGSIHRKLNLSKINGSEFSGGMQMQFNGNLGKNTNVSGILNDEGDFLQPEGYTRNLQEFDQIYLNISSSNYSISAGNIIFRNTYDSKHIIDRKLTGIKNNFDFNNWKGSSVYASSRGLYHTILLKGRDGDQGPYKLLGKNGEREIIILSGSETVWIDGEKITRGYLNDYTIDYSLSEIYFTSNILLRDDLDIFVEYQYIDNDYSKGFLGASLKRSINENIISFGLYRDKDQIENGTNNKNPYSFVNTFKNTNAGRKKINTSAISIDGDYILIDSVFTYDPEKQIIDSTRYDVSFSYDQFGSYSRKVSLKGMIYYQYEQPEDRKTIEILYSPYKYIEAPKNHKFGFFGIKRQLNNNIIFDGYFSGSKFDNNILSNFKNLSQIGTAYNFSIKGDSVYIGKAKVQFSLQNELKDDNYISFDKRTAIENQNFWKESEIIYNGVKNTKAKLNVFIPQFGNSTFENSNLRYKNNVMNGFRFKHNVDIDKIKDSFIDISRIFKPDGRFQRLESKINFTTSKITPFIHILNEYNPMINRYNHTSIGIRSKTDINDWLTSLELREQKNNIDSSKIVWGNHSRDIIASLNYRTNSQSSWRKDIVLKRRIKTYEEDKADLNYFLSTIKLIYRDHYSPLGLDFLLKSEKTNTDNRLIVYDSIGVGLGQYRYEAAFNTYVPDNNGSYVAYLINNGEKNQEIKLEGHNRLIYDFGKKSDLKLLVSSDLKINHKGESFNRKDVSNFSRKRLEKNFTKIFNRFEFNYYGYNRLLFWLEEINSYNGKDPRGVDLENFIESGIDINPYKNKSFTLKSRSKYRENYIKSTISQFRNRNVLGWWQEFHLLYHRNSIFNFDFSVSLGEDKGEFYNNPFKSFVNGFSFKSKLFLKKSGRIETTFEIFNVSDSYNNKSLPPEIFKGLTTGINIKSNTRAQMYINNLVSLILSLNVIDDKRYKNLITVNAEVRANF